MNEKTFHCITFGCQMNVNDSLWVERALIRRGLKAAPLEQADIVFVNTCSVREKPEQKVHSTLGRIKQANPDAIIGVAGCVAQQLGDLIMKRHPQVHLVAGSDGVANVPDAFLQLLENPNQKFSYLDFMDAFPDRDPCLIGVNLSGSQSEKTAVAYVNIMQGCNNFCAYCIVPYTRGRCKSRSTKSVIEECQAWANLGAGDITLLGQNVNVFGMDKNADGVSFPDLIRKVAEIPGVRRIRYVSAHPRDFSEELIELYAEIPQLCPRLHLPLQSGSDSMLKKMGRKYDMAQYMHVVDGLRKVRPDFALSTDLIVGFPSETEEEFEDTLASIDRCGFMSSFSFCYSDRPGTRASSMPFKIPHDVQLARLDKLQTLQNDRAEKWLQSRVGICTDVLLEDRSVKQSPESDMWQGKDPWGDVVNVAMPIGIGKIGDFIDVRIIEAKKHSLMATPYMP